MKHNNNYCSFQIEINNQKKIKLSIIDTNKKQTILQLPKKTQEYFPITIEFGLNNIIVCEENTNSISCIKEVFDNPDEYHFKTITIQHFLFKKCFTFCEKIVRVYKTIFIFIFCVIRKI